MTPKNTADPEGDDSLGVLDDTPSSDTTGIGLLGGTAQVSVALPKGDDDDLADDEVIGGEIVSDLIIDTSAVADEDTVARISQDAPDIVIELPAEDLPAGADEGVEPVIVEESRPASGAPVSDEIVIEVEPLVVGDEPGAVAPASGSDEVVDGIVVDEVAEDATVVDAAVSAPEEAVQPLAHIESAVAVAKAELREAMAPPAKKAPARKAAAKKTAAKRTPSKAAAVKDAAPETAASTAVVEDTTADDVPAADDAGVVAVTAEARRDVAPLTASPAPAAAAPPASPMEHEQQITHAEESTPVPNDQQNESRAASDAARGNHDVPLTSKRLDDLGDAARESADLLTADRLLDPSRVAKPEPEGTWSHLLYAITGGRINIGDSRKARERKQLTARIAAPLAGTARFVPVLSRKGGVGKTTVTALLGMALADARDDRVIAVDANPDRGTLAERVVGSHAKSVRDLVRAQHEIRGFHDISALVARDETRLDVLASDSDPRVAEAFGDAGYRDVAAVAAQYYSLVLTDSGTGIVHSVMGATLDLADQLVIVSGLSVDEARLASETLTWLETNGYAELAREAVVVLNQSTPGAPLVRLSELEAHFSTRAKHVLRIPYDPQIAGGGAIDFSSLQPETRRAARELAAHLVEGLRARAA